MARRELKDGAHVVLHRKLKTSGRRRALAILLVKRTLDAPSDAGDWGLVGGGMKAGETSKEAVLRELNEEICYRGGVRVHFLCKTRRRDKGGDPYSIFFYSAHLPEDMDTLKLKRNNERNRKVEGEGLAWFTRDEVCSLCVRPQDLPAVDKFFSTFS